MVFWSDSMTTLHWINASPRTLKTFVANRVTEIQEITNPITWKHVRSAENPADALSRGQTPQELMANKLWFEGPEWLNKSEEDWPNSAMEVPELKMNSAFIAMVCEHAFMKKYSSYLKLIRIVAYCFRFLPQYRSDGSLNAFELDRAELRILRYLQAVYFAETIRNLKGEERKNPPGIANLSPFLHDDGLIRVGGRLQNSSLSFDQRHPILLPRCHQISDNIIRETHEKHQHAGIKATLCNIRQKYWIVDGHNQVCKIVRRCVRCYRLRAQVMQYKMGNQASVRVRQSIPFEHTGVDFAGPFI